MEVYRNIKIPIFIRRLKRSASSYRAKSGNLLDHRPVTLQNVIKKTIAGNYCSNERKLENLLRFTAFFYTAEEENSKRFQPVKRNKS